MPLDGYVLPGEEHVEKLVDFVTGWDRTAPIVVHCYAGISRSTAGAFIAACALNPKRDERMIARLIRDASPTAHAEFAAGGARRRSARPQGPHDQGGRRARTRPERL